MIVHLVAYAIFCLNEFPPSTPGAGMLDKKSPGKLILGNMVNYKEVCRLQPGDYIQVHQENEPRNTIAINRTIGAISLGAQFNLQGGYFFESTPTGKRLWRSYWNPVNITEDVIDRYVNVVHTYRHTNTKTAM